MELTTKKDNQEACSGKYHHTEIFCGEMMEKIHEATTQAVRQSWAGLKI